MKLKKSRKKNQRIRNHKKHTSIYSFRFVILSSVIVVLGIIITIAISNSSSQNAKVMGTSTFLTDENSSAGKESQSTGESKSSDAEKKDPVEPTETPEPTDRPEVKHSIDEVKHEIDTQIEHKTIDNLEIHAPQEGSDSGKIILQHAQGATNELQVPVSHTEQITHISDPQAGTVSVHVAGANSLTIKNGPYSISTQYPVVMNPADQSMAIKTPGGTTVLKTFPSQILENAQPENKLSSLTSLSLIDQQGTLVYQADGIQIRKFLGIFPVKAPVREQINAQTGEIKNTDLPWYFSKLGFMFQSI